jgi:undecaprenyl-diphosphatase
MDAMDSVIIFCAKYLFVVVILLYLWAIFQASKRDRKALVAAFIIAGIVAVILDKLGGKLYYDPRPFVSHSVTPLIKHAPDNGFPSEHTIFSMTTAVLLFYYRRRLGGLAIVIAYIVGAARVAAHVHSPIDIIGGIIMAIIAASAGYFVTEKWLGAKRHAVRPQDSR